MGEVYDLSIVKDKDEITFTPYNVEGSLGCKYFFHIYGYGPIVSIDPNDNEEYVIISNFSGEKIATLNYSGEVKAHVDDVVGSLNKLEEDVRGRKGDICVVHSYILLIRSYFMRPDPDSWKKNPLL